MTIDLQITKSGNNPFALEQYGIIVKDFIVSSLPMNSTYAQREGGHGTIDYGSTYGTRTITVPFTLKAYDLMDYPLLRDKLFELVNDANPFYIREMRRVKKLAYAFVDTNEQPKMDTETNNRLIGGKRYLVRLQNTFDLEQVGLYGESELIFETTELPFAESIGTTQDIHADGISANEELWGFGMGLIADDTSLIYTHTGTTFRVFNAGNIPVHPFEQDLKITINNIQGSSDYFELRNVTNGTRFRTVEGVSDGDEIEVDGPNVTKNSLAFLRGTTKEFIELDQGWNEFEISGATNATVDFDFRFYYK